MRITALLLCLAIFLSACTATSTPPPKVTVSSEAFSSVPLNARRLEIIENWQMPIEAPYIGHLQHPLPSSLVAEWASTVLTPAGGSGEHSLRPACDHGGEQQLLFFFRTNE